MNAQKKKSFKPYDKPLFFYTNTLIIHGVEYLNNNIF